MIDFEKLSKLDRFDEFNRLQTITNFYNNIGQETKFLDDQYLNLTNRIKDNINSPDFTLSNMDYARLYDELGSTLSLYHDDPDTIAFYFENLRILYSLTLAVSLFIRKESSYIAVITILKIILF